VPIENAERFAVVMDEAGNRCELVSYEGRSHGFFNLSRSEEDYQDTVAKKDDFLVSMGWLS